MDILVTGGAGYIGSHTVKALLQRHHRVVIFDSLEKGHKETIATLQTLGELEFIEGNLLDSESLFSVFQHHHFDAVIHFAAYIEAGESVEDPTRFFWNNTAGSLNLLRAMLEHKVHQLVFSSTAAVYGQPEKMPIPETAPKQPTNPYGTSKLLVEQAIADITHLTPLKATILRYFNACGADPDGQLGELHKPETHLIPLVLQVAAGQRDQIKIFGTDYPTPDGTCIRDYIHVTDLAEAHVAALEQSTPLAIYNVATGQGYSVKEIIDACRKVTNQPISASEEPRRPGDPAKLIADPTKIKAELNWTPRHSDLETIISTAWRWQQEKNRG